MTAKEWLNVIKQARDYNPEMTPLIEKYGEMLLDEYKALNPDCDCDNRYSKIRNQEDEENELNEFQKNDWRIPSKELANIIGTEEKILKTDVVKKFWDYIKQNKLQDQTSKRYIIIDEKLRTVIDTNNDRISMFELSKHINKHLTKAE